MSYCVNCGAYIPLGEHKCLACGYIDSTALGIAAKKNMDETDKSEKSGLKSSAYGERPVTRYSSQRRNGGKGAVRRYSSKMKNSKTPEKDKINGNSEN